MDLWMDDPQRLTTRHLCAAPVPDFNNIVLMGEAHKQKTIIAYNYLLLSLYFNYYFGIKLMF